MIRRSPKKSPNNALKGFVPIQPEEEQLIALLDAGKIEEFRRRVDADRVQRRREMFTRVLSGR